MADAAPAPLRASAPSATGATARHSLVVRLTHWVTVLCFFSLLATGLELIVSHPRFYWGEAGNILSEPLFVLPIPASRSSVVTGYSRVMPDENGWSRYLHFQSAWLLVMTGGVYLISGFLKGHFTKNLVPERSDLSPRSLRSEIASRARWERPPAAEAQRYGALQRLTYLAVIFVFSPLIIWTGLAMSPSFVSAFPATVTVWGGQQSARTIHFLVTLALVLFLVIHILMVWLAGFRSRMRSMLTGGTAQGEEQ